mmetsp:Transcript_29224/g.87383  ORF Transcript_29224/g.87383 Transcript_29224/m.87383 type:complete len:219 (-) Transcript_29224:113-769(-)
MCPNLVCMLAAREARRGKAPRRQAPRDAVLVGHADDRDDALRARRRGEPVQERVRHVGVPLVHQGAVQFGRGGLERADDGAHRRALFNQLHRVGDGLFRVRGEFEVPGDRLAEGGVQARDGLGRRRLQGGRKPRQGLVDVPVREEHWCIRGARAPQGRRELRARVEAELVERLVEGANDAAHQKGARALREGRLPPRRRRRGRLAAEALDALVVELDH